MGQYNDMYNMCCQYHGKRVRITDNQGKVHVGTITRVDRRQVWLMPDRGMGGYGFGWGWGYGGGFGYGIALGAITGIALAGAFFW
ncbi:hypothetical protein [Lysinibacillus odysseyi]|uniref:Uncharacterized protein n=1 Tax=Lysinibacillus odysseyi 34hs-1 = NBRC 100172 TaxID=1220589 RepID=A0A0A3INE2_9BACI|nr:hypothetical protein [Lysinibacillus odysseyi]KGR84333.1 hypothetical protein CD32_12110 [Lysinibacillus odysseyi 34hs-1 = NBRC 100172]